MRYGKGFTSVVVCILLVAGLVPGVALGTGYQFVDLGPAGFDNSSVQDASGGQIVGGGWGPATGGNKTHALLWQAGSSSPVDLHPSGLKESYALATSGTQQVGMGAKTDVAIDNHALLWSGSAASVVDLHPEGFTWSTARGIAGSYQVGYGYGPVSSGEWHALLWSGSAASVVDLHPAGFDSSNAYAIAGNGQVVGAGQVSSPGEHHALLWESPSGPVVDLNPSSGVWSYARGTDGQQQVGYAYTVAGQRAMLWSGSAATAIDLTPEGIDASEALGVHAGQQVGWGSGTATGGYRHALVWFGGPNSFVDLHTSVPSQYGISSATSIDELGNIYGYVQVDADSEARAAMWAPVPEPATALLLGGLLLPRLLGGGRKRGE